MTTTLRTGLAFLLGFGFSFLPNLAPFIALLVVFSERWQSRRMDAVWLASSVLLALPLALTGSPREAGLTLVQVLSGWLLYRAFGMLRRLPSPILRPRMLALGLLAGLATTVAAGWLQIDRIDPALQLSQAIVWEGSPALFGHTVLTLGLLIAALAPRAIYRAPALALSAVGILLSGSREAAIAWVVVTLALMLLAPMRSRLGKGLEALMLVGMLLVAAGVGSQYGFGRVGFLLDLAPASSSRNLLTGTESGRGDWWFARGVAVEEGRAELGELEPTRYLVTKTAPEGWRRLQQVVTLEPHQPYTASVWLRPESAGAEPGLQGWGERPDGGAAFVLGAALRGERWRAFATGEGRVLSSGSSPGPSGWERVWVSFQYEGAAPLRWWFGLAPDGRAGTRGAASFAGFQLEEGREPSAYEPGPATQGLALANARLPYWRTAWRAFLERPWAGWGTLGFDRYYRESGPGLGGFYEVPAHTHNLFLQVLYERGLLGLAGLGALLLALGRQALRRRDAPLLLALGGVLLANLFDYSLFYGGVFYPLAAVAGWRAAAPRAGERTADEGARQAVVRLTLALADGAAALAALAIGAAVAGALGFGGGFDPFGPGTPPALYYSLLLWPAAAARERLYPGYGLTAPQELSKQVVAALQAGVILAAGTFLFGDALPLPRSVLVATVAASLVLAPMTRAIVKRLLLRLGVWGRPVIVLGAGSAGRRVARALRRTPLDGLHPLAFFDDDPTKRHRRFHGLRVMGTLADADAFSRRHGVTHAIVAIPSLPRDALARLVDAKGRHFRRVQFVPELAGLPSEDVYASNLDGMLALEVRNGLYLRRNRLVKRATDLVVGGIGALLISPLLLALYLWVRLDSRGPAFYRSARVGEGGVPFRCLKFRTMYVDAEERLQELLAGDERLREEYGRYHKLEHDPRVTPAGAVLRRLSLDELPQLWNVLTGEMSLVGPRPYLTRELPDMRPYGDVIFRAKPGLTGYWQVTGRSEVTFDDRLRMEAHYVRNWSVWWDVILLVRTPVAVLDRRGAR